MSLIANVRGLRRTTCALALPAFPLALLAGDLVSPTDSTVNADQLRAAAAHGSAWQAAALIELLAAALMPFAVAGIVQAVRSRGAALAAAGGVLGVLGTLGMALIAARHLFVYGLAGGDHATALDVLDRVDNGAGALALPLLFAAPIAFVVLSAAAVRAGFAPRWITAGAIVFVVVDMLPIPGAEAVQALVGLGTFGALAVRMLGLADEPENAAPAARPGPAAHVAAAANVEA